MSLVPTRIQRRLAHLWHPLPTWARACLLLWIALGSLGLVRFALVIPSALQAARMGDDAQRRANWPPAYGFASACSSRLAPGTTLLLIDPLDPANFYDHRPYDERNLGIFTYILYPRVVTPLGVVPSDWNPAAIQTDYVAIWEQSADRSQAMQAVAQATERKLSQALPGQAICTYSGAQNARGVLFAVSPRALAAAFHTTPASGSGAPTAGQATAAVAPVSAYLRSLAGLASLWLIGWLALLLFPRRAIASRLAVALAFPLGCLGVALELLLTSLAGLPWSAGVLALPWLALALLALWRQRRWLSLAAARRAWSRLLRPVGRSAVPGRAPLALDERLALGLLAAIALVSIVVAPAELPVLDGFAMYYFKSRAFVSDGSVVSYYQHASALLFSAPAHPPLVSLVVTWLYLWIGGISEHATLLLWPAFLLALLAGFYALARSAVSRRLALWATLSLALVGFPGHILGGTLPWQMYDSLALTSLVVGWVDLPLAVFLLLGCGLFWRWAGPGSERRTSWLVLAGLFLGGAVLTKEEGLTAACIALAVSPLLGLWRGQASGALLRGSWWRPLACAAPGFVLCAFPWLLLRARYPIPDFRILISPAVLVQNLVASVAGFGIWIVAYWLAPLVLIAACVLERRRRRAPLTAMLSARLVLLACVVVGQVAIDMVSIATISVNAAEVNGELHTAVSRLLMQLLPLIFLGTLSLWPDLLAQRDAAPAAPAEAQDAVPAAHVATRLPV